MASVSEAVALAFEHHAGGRAAEAETLYRRVLEVAPEHAGARHLLGLLLAQTGRVPEGLAEIETAIAGAPEVSVFHLNRGKLLKALGRVEEAVGAWVSVHAVEIEAAEAAARGLHALADRAFDAGDPRRARDLYRRSLALKPGNARACGDLAAADRDLGRLERAVRPARAASRLDPGFRQAAELEGECLRRLGRADEAVDAFERAIRAAPDDAGLRAVLADTLSAAGAAPERVIRAFRPAAALDPARTDVWINLHLADGSLAIARRAVRSAPDHPTARAALCAARLAGEDTRGAVRSGRLAAALGPHDADVWTNLAAALEVHAFAHEAGRAARRALRLHPGDPAALATLARAAERFASTGETIRLTRGAIVLSPADAETWALAARSALVSGNAREAERAAIRALVVAPNSPRAILALGAAREVAGRREEALVAYERVIRGAPGLGTGFTRRAALLLGRSRALPTPRRPSGAPRLSVTTLGSNGRFGNQLLRYGVARITAELGGLEVETPDWIGRRLYGLDDPLPGTPLPALDGDEVGLSDLLSHAGRWGGRDLVGYFRDDASPLAPYRDLFRSRLTPVGRAARVIERANERIRDLGKTLVAIHLRRGDFGSDRFWIAPETWYLEWLADLWPELDDPVLYLATDAPELAGRFAAYQPITAADLDPPPAGAEFLVDHAALTLADALAASNSSFSITAAMLNTRATRLVRPSRDRMGLIPFDPWGGPVLFD